MRFDSLLAGGCPIGWQNRWAATLASSGGGEVRSCGTASIFRSLSLLIIILISAFHTLGLYPSAALAEPLVTITIPGQTLGPAIPADFVGLSFGMRAMLPGEDGNLFFSPTNKPLIALFQNIGINHLRMGGTTVESPPTTAIPGTNEIDNLFGFVEAAHVKKVIYSFRLLETNAALRYDITNAALARYIWDNHRNYLDSFSIGNEPDLSRVFKQDVNITNFTSYLVKWRRFAAAISNAVPLAKFAGPDGGSGNIKWTTNFAARVKEAGNISSVTEHFYVGGAGRNVTPEQGIADMLSPLWDARNDDLYQKMARSVLQSGLPYRFTEANDHYTGGVTNASDTFAGALWALDFLHWWAARGASGIDFHNTQWVVSDVVTLDAGHQPVTTPKGYAFRAFNIGSEGSPEQISLDNPSSINLTAYAVANATNEFVTLINKEHGPVLRAAKVSIVLSKPVKQATVMWLAAPNDDVTAKTGVTLGGGTINNKGTWQGEWKPLTLDTSGACTVPLPAASAAIVKFSR